MSMDDQNIQFPLHVQTGEGDFVIERDEDLHSPTSPDYFGSPDSLERGVRLKRRRRCGQCGPCQVKENCNKCHFCVRRDVLKQTCIYRKCVYLRSKPKPYARPKDSSQHGCSAADGGRPSSQEGDRTVTSPQLSYTNSLQCSDGVASPPNRSDVAKPARAPTPKMSEHFTFNSFRPPFSALESGIQPPQQHLPHSQTAGTTPQSPPGLPSIPSSVPSMINQHTVVPPPMHGLLDQSTTFSHNHQMMMRPHKQNNTERVFNDFSGQQMIGMPPSLNSQSPSVPHHSFNFRDSQNRSDMHYPGFSKSPINNGKPGPPSSCLYPPNIPPPIGGSAIERPGVFGVPSAPTYFPTNAEMFRHFPTLPPSYPYPPGVPRFGQNFPPSPYARYGSMGMPPPPPNLPLPRPQSTHHPQTWGFPQPFNNYEQSDTCPKNGCCPPVSQNSGSDALVMQEKYGNIHSFKNASCLSAPLHLDLVGHQRWLKRPESVLSDDSGRFSMASSDFESDVISIDDCQMNALIRTDGCNSLQIEIESPTTPDVLARKSTKSSSSSLSSSSSKESPIKKPEKEKESAKEKYIIPGTVCLKQDLGEEGIIQLEIPGHKVTLEESYLDDKLAQYSSNIKELLEFIGKEPQIEYLRDN